MAVSAAVVAAAAAGAGASDLTTDAVVMPPVDAASSCGVANRSAEAARPLAAVAAAAAAAVGGLLARLACHRAGSPAGQDGVAELVVVPAAVGVACAAAAVAATAVAAAVAAVAVTASAAVVGSGTSVAAVAAAAVVAVAAATAAVAAQQRPCGKPCFQGEAECEIPVLQVHPWLFGSLAMPCPAAWLAVAEATAEGASAVEVPEVTVVVQPSAVPSSTGAAASPEAAAGLAPAAPHQ